uniref:spondin-1-like n=1 Tax=Pristiophorus japonicus TaxID=55135 RepID=UPI00398F2C8D
MDSTLGFLALLLAVPAAFASYYDENPVTDGYCSRIVRSQGSRRDGNTGFSLRIEGNPQFYTPGSTYRVTLSATVPSYFRGFTLIALLEGEDGDREEEYAGNFQSVGLSDRCRNPTKRPDQERENEGGRKRSYGTRLKKSRGIIPEFATHWSAIIGASHSKSYRLWEYGGFASDGVQQVAEWGSPVKMEEEIRQKGDSVLTVIKAKAQWPAWQPLNVRAAPSAEFSVDPTRHLMSFLTMLGPSPDWNVGLSAEDLCTKDCGWVQKVIQDLIPWDAGTDSGVTYLAPNQQAEPQERIRPLTSLDHPKSPFYDPEGGPIVPVARVVIERIARKGEQCNIQPDNVDDIVADLNHEEKDEDDTPETCIYSNWSQWSACSSSTCEKGKRMRQRMLKAQLDLSVPCPHTQDFEPCMGPGCRDDDASTCMMSEWISWSPCSLSCGMGMRSRERYIKQYPEDGSVCTLPTEEKEKCIVNEECASNTCFVTEWGEWEECSASCGMGSKRRLRMVKMHPSDGSMCKVETVQMEKCGMPDCQTIPCMLTLWSDWSDCSVTCGIGMRSRWRMLKSPAEVGECNEELEQVEKCMLPECPTDCMVSDWSEWSECNKSCGKGHVIRSRTIKLEPQFGGALCPETVQRKKCKVRKCSRRLSDEKRRRKEAPERQRNKQLRGDPEIPEHTGCKMRPWTGWNECSKFCGGGIQERFMVVKRKYRTSQITSCKDMREIRACSVHPC